MKIQYGINKRNPVRIGRPKVLHENHSMELSGGPGDSDWHQKVRAAIQAKHPGWAVTGWAEIKVGPHTLTIRV